MIVFLVGNRIDLDTERVISREEGAEKAKTINARFFEVSAKTGENVNELFYAIASSFFHTFVQTTQIKARMPVLDSRPLQQTVLSLSSNGLQRTEKSHFGDRFTFFIGEYCYSCPTVIAEFLSPRVSLMRSADWTIDEFHLETADPHEWFSGFFGLGFGHELTIDNELRSEHLNFLRSICEELSNSELLDKLLPPLQERPSRAELISRLEFLSLAGLECTMELKGLALLFYEFDGTDLELLSLSTLERILSDPDLVLVSEDWFFDIICHLGSKECSYISLLRFVRFEFVSDKCITRAIDLITNSFEFLTRDIWQAFTYRLTLPVKPPPNTRQFVPMPLFDSKILWHLPNIFSPFGWRKLQLLYRGSSHGFGCKDFHRLCNGHSNTLTIIKTSENYIFGGYSPLEWRSRDSGVSDGSLKSFLFTIKNPHNLRPRIFVQQKKKHAIHDTPTTGPSFGAGYDILISAQSDSGLHSVSNLGVTYVNDTGLAGTSVFAGSSQFNVAEIEVFEVS
jgi:hypothetical protein